MSINFEREFYYKTEVSLNAYHQIEANYFIKMFLSVVSKRQNMSMFYYASIPYNLPSGSSEIFTQEHAE